jgi:hypothetical protein
MERQLLHRLQEIEQSVQMQLAEHARKINQLEGEVRARDQMIYNLNTTLKRFLGPLLQDGSSPS